MRFLACLTQQHDLALVALVALFCVAGSWIVIRLYLRSREVGRGSPVGWLFLGSVAGGSTIWCTHFVGMLAYRPGVPVSFDAALTGVSLAVAIIGAGIGLAIARLSRPMTPELGGAVFGAGIAAMHYTGMMAFTVRGFVAWDLTYVAASIALSVTICACAFSCAARASGGLAREGAASAILISSIIALHFTGMASMAVTAIRPAAGGTSSNDAYNALAVAVAGVGLLVLGTGLASFMLDRESADRARAHVTHLVESAIDGVVIEQGGVIVEVNAVFAALTGFTLEDLRDRAFSRLLAGGDLLVEDKLLRADILAADGQSIPVEIVAHGGAGQDGVAGMSVYSVRDLRERLAQERRMTDLATKDSLTGLPNRASFVESFSRSIQTCPVGAQVALLAIDLDSFKDVNDIHGHAVGDQILCILADRMCSAAQPGELVARLGSDEFVATVTASHRKEVYSLARRIAILLSEPIILAGAEIACEPRVGVACYPDDGATSTTVMNNADLARRRAKKSLSTNICFYDEEMDDVSRSRRKLTLDLREALANDQFEMNYQVQASANGTDITGYEALLRWNHPVRGSIAPSDFIPAAEESGLIVPIGEWVLRTACAQAASWDAPHKVAINLSAIQLASIELPRLVHEVLLETGLAPSRLELEITESALIDDPGKTLHLLRQIKAMGVSIAMDDFGVGYSSLSTLRSFPFDKIKLDKSFMDELDRSPQAKAVIRAVIALGKGLGIIVLAEGVETDVQLRFLRDEGCDQVQGYLLGRPGREPQPLLLKAPPVQALRESA